MCIRDRQRLIANSFQFTESPRTLSNREYVKSKANNVSEFMESEGYIRLKADCEISARELYAIYCMWCEENAQAPVRSRSFSDFLMENQKKYNLEHNNLVTNAAGRRVWGFMGIEALVSPNMNGAMADSPRTYVQD